ncbi:hypothetical protein EXIGLDRAFT_759224 [Exidia glandulosa HHB12029]|uniref:Uncharacterized protein n=1 Tax=Exidia glandulosa HHB12029 TaxID=1314781 RepID=A0A165QBC2_EXIGL|nr:hypothetical protein EXIGLDRAFT_759224 [Exidia glandulosa HHB12029]
MKHSESSAPGASLPVELVDEIFDIFAWDHATTAKHALATAALTSKTIHHRIRPVLYHTVCITVANFRALARTCRERLERNPFSLTRQLIIQTNALYVIESRAGIFDKFAGITSICAVPYEVELWLMTESAHRLTVAALFVAQGTGFWGNGLPWRWNPTNLTHLALYVEPVPRLDPALELRDIYPKLTHVMLDLTRPHTTIGWHLEIAERYLLLPTMQRVLLVISTATPVDRRRVDMPALELLDLVPHRLVDKRLCYVDVAAPEDPFDPTRTFDLSLWERGSPLSERFEPAAA